MPIVLVIGSAFLYYFSFPNIFLLHGFSFLGWLFAIPFFWALEGRTLGERFWLGLVWGMVAHGLLVQWLMPITVSGYVLFVLALAIQGVIFALLAIPLTSLTQRLVYYPSLWVASEFFRSCLMGGFSWSTAYSQSFQPDFIQAAFVGGVYAVSWIMLLVNAALFLSLRSGFKRDRYWVVAGAVFLLNWVLGAGVVSLTPVKSIEAIRVSTVQANVSHEDKLSLLLYDKNVARHLLLSKQSVVAGYPDLVVWPETAFPDDILKDKVWGHKMLQLAKNFRAHFLVGSALLQDGHDLNAALLISPQGEWKDIYAKRHLVPFSEYRPKDKLSLKIYAWAGLKGYDFLAGTRVGLFSFDRMIREVKKTEAFGVAICSEEGYPLLFRDLARKGAGFMVVMLNDGWFRAPQALVMHAQMGVFRAVETHRSIVRSANTGWTVMIDPVGRTSDQPTARLQEPGFAFFDVVSDHDQTPFVRFGDFFIFGCLGFVIISFVSRLFPKRSKHV